MPHLCLHPRCLSAAVATIPNSAASSPIPIRRCIRPSSFSEPGTGAMNRRQGPAASTRLRHDRCQLATSPSGGIHALVPLPKFLKRQPADSTHAVYTKIFLCWIAMEARSHSRSDSWCYISSSD
ncbi:hypothetical protein BRADI_5g01602v3 [Brachypodium distachyon]|uniref:Uncharacterized protein n=1 Tax=Brachypodium distachyon TaxID=15368 RepID=A0A0Q3E1N6_BRADI|nr:hypothetical protein BRADI_5g01602v3 [Brachypodium distachyon]KQJ81590.1 hypothetical protein BRADI_5g01602v3 [Brachypodium distachyon]PNT60562.1 hypothetical protein BRADI_5g01602v3 [Brachypodium distachyon]PNT60564.1 hypothetical protein BRADI_5g01602v3 [Brachypodium distachyon]